MQESQAVGGFESYPNTSLGAQGFGDDFLNFDLAGDAGSRPPKQTSPVPKQSLGSQQFNLL